MRRLVYYISVTQDGFIAGPDGEYDFFVMNDDLADTLNARFPETVPTDLREAVGITEENKVFDTVLMGRNTYEVGLPHGIASPYQQLRQYVFSTTLDEFPGPGVELVAGDPVAKVRELKAEDGMDIWLCGGGTLAGVLYHEVGALILKRLPILIGSPGSLTSSAGSPRASSASRNSSPRRAASPSRLTRHREGGWRDRSGKTRV